MKKVVGILGVITLATSMFFSTINSNAMVSNINLAFLASLNAANPENGGVYGATPELKRCAYYNPDGSFSSSVKTICTPNYWSMTTCFPTSCGG